MRFMETIKTYSVRTGAHTHYVGCFYEWGNGNLPGGVTIVTRKGKKRKWTGEIKKVDLYYLDEVSGEFRLDRTIKYVKDENQNIYPADDQVRAGFYGFSVPNLDAIIATIRRYEAAIARGEKPLV